jgi:hypothetical protein
VNAERYEVQLIDPDRLRRTIARILPTSNPHLIIALRKMHRLHFILDAAPAHVMFAGFFLWLAVAF